MQLPGPRGLWAGGGRPGSLHPAQAAASAAWAPGPRQNHCQERPCALAAPRTGGAPQYQPFPRARLLGAGFWFPSHCSLFIHSCLRACTCSFMFTHSFSAQSSQGQRGQAQSSQSWLGAPAPSGASGGKPLIPAGVVLLWGLSGGWRVLARVRPAAGPRLSCVSVPWSREAQGPVSLTGAGPAFSRLQLADGCLWPLLAQAAQSCCPHRHHQAFTHRRSRQVRPPHAHVCSLSMPAHPCVHTGPGAVCLGQSHTLPWAPWGHGTHVCENSQMPSTVAPLGTPTRASLPRARMCPGHLLHLAPPRVYRGPCPAVPAPTHRPVFVL